MKCVVDFRKGLHSNIVLLEATAMLAAILRLDLVSSDLMNFMTKLLMERGIPLRLQPIGRLVAT